MRTIDLEKETREKRLNRLDEVLHRDPGGRGLASAGVKDPVGQLYDALKDVKRAVLLTGFPVRRLIFLPVSGAVSSRYPLFLMPGSRRNRR